MGLFSYALKKKFSGDPKTLTQLRDQTMDKLAEYKEKGTYCFALETAGDEDAAMVISWTGSAGDKDYGKIAVPKKKGELILGNYVADKKKKTYDLSLDSADYVQAAFKKFMATPSFPMKIWSLFEKDSLNQLKVNGVVIPNPKYADQQIYSKAWNLTQALRLAGQKDGSPLAGPALEGIEITEGKTKIFVSKGGIRLPAEIPVNIDIKGQIAKDAKENPQTWAFVRDDLPQIFVAQATKLKDTLIKLDAKPKKDAKEIDKLIADFQSTFSKAVDEHVAEQWLLLAEARVERRAYRFEAATTIIKGTISVGVGAASFAVAVASTAATGGALGAGAYLSLVGTVKGALEFGAKVYQLFRDVEGMRAELDENLNKIIVSYASGAGWKDLGKSALSKIPAFGPLIQLFGSKTKAGAAIKPADLLKKDVELFGMKLATLIANANDLGKDVNQILDKQEAFMKALDADEKKYPQLKASNDKKRTKSEKVVDELISKIANMGEDFRKSAGYKKKFAEAIDEMEKLKAAGFEESKIANFLNKYALPLMDAPWSVDPDKLAETLLANAGTMADLARQAAEDIATLTKLPESVRGVISQENLDQVKELKDHFDTAKTVKEMLEEIKKITKF